MMRWKWLGNAMAVLLLLAGCGRTDSGQTQALQAQVGALLDDPGKCPTGNSADVQRLIGEADPDQVVLIPAGCYEISETVVIPNGLQVAGAGMDKTILYRNPETSRKAGGAILQVFGRKGKAGPQISGMALVGVRDTQDSGEDYGIILSSVEDFRINHCYFEGFGFAAVRSEGRSRGVIDHSIFVDNYKEGINNLGYGVAVYGANEWADEPGAGTAEATFVEDNTFVGSRHAIAASGGAHYVFRHNLIQRNVVACAVDAHGPGFGWTHGTRYVEIYGNEIEQPAYRECGIGIRGGDGVIFGNTIRGYRDPILLILEWGTPESLKASYPAKEQIRDLWIWDNKVDGGRSETEVHPNATGFVEEGRDYLTEPKPGYVPYPYPHPLTSGGSLDVGVSQQTGRP